MGPLPHPSPTTTPQPDEPAVRDPFDPHGTMRIMHAAEQLLVVMTMSSGCGIPDLAVKGATFGYAAAAAHHLENYRTRSVGEGGNCLGG